MGGIISKYSKWANSAGSAGEYCSVSTRTGSDTDSICYPPPRTQLLTLVAYLCSLVLISLFLQWQGSKGSVHGHRPHVLCLEPILLGIDSSFDFSHQGFILNLKSVDLGFWAWNYVYVCVCVCVCVNPKLLIYHFPNISPLVTLS